MIEDRINYYIEIVAINKIKAFIKCKRDMKKFRKYDNEIDNYIRIAKKRL